LTSADIREGLKLQGRTLNLLTVLLALGAMFMP